MPLYDEEELRRLDAQDVNYIPSPEEEAAPKPLDRQALMSQVLNSDEMAKLREQANQRPSALLNIMKFFPRLQGAYSAGLADQRSRAGQASQELMHRISTARELENDASRDKDLAMRQAEADRKRQEFEAGQSSESPQAQVYRQLIKKRNPELSEYVDQMGSHDLSKILTPVETATEHDLKREDLRTNRAQQYELRKEGLENKKEAKTSGDLNKRFEQLENNTNPAKRGSGLLSKLQTQVDQAEALETLGMIGGKVAALNPQQQVEAARMLDSILAQGGQATVSITHELVPKTIGRSGAQILQWISNSPQDAKAQKFTQYMLDTAQREKALRVDQLRNHQSEAFTANYDLKDKDPEQWDRKITARGFSPEDFDEKGKYVRKVVPGGTDKDLPTATTEVEKIAPNGKTAIFDSKTKKFIRYK